MSVDEIKMKLDVLLEKIGLNAYQYLKYGIGDVPNYPFVARIKRVRNMLDTSNAEIAKTIAINLITSL